MLEQQTLASVCVYAWRGTVCPPENCLYKHNRVTGTAQLVAAQQQQRQQQLVRLPLPPPPPSPPVSPQQPLQNTAAGAEGGAQQVEEAEGCGPRASPVIARNTRLLAGAERLLGVERDGAMAATDSTGSDVRQGRLNSCLLYTSDAADE